MKSKILGLLAVGLLAGPMAASAAVANFTDKTTYLSAAGPQTTIAFTGFASGTVLDSQFSGSGITFTDGNDRILADPAFVTDGFGAGGADPMSFNLASYAFSIGADFPGALTFALYDGATLVGTSSNFGQSGREFFGGVISNVGFNRVLITDWFAAPAYVDNLYFGGASVPEPGTLALLGLGLAGLGLSRRRKAN